MTQVKMGALFLDDVAQINPQQPTCDGDIPIYDGISKIMIADAPDNSTNTLITWNVVHDMEKWSCTDTLLIADRVLLRSISWEDLAAEGFVEGVDVLLKGRKYRCHLLWTVEENFAATNAWDDALDRTTEDDAIWHWKDSFFWERDEVAGKSFRAIRGCYSAHSYTLNTSSNRYVDYGFRPALEPLDCTDPAILCPEY